jgi:hypothetical protein
MLFAIIILFIGAMIMLKVKENIRMEKHRGLIERQQINETIHIILKELEKQIKIDELLQEEPATHLIGHHRM